MFEKLVSRLPFQPSLLADLVYYSHRLRQEAALRRIGFLCTALILIFQMLVIVFPATSSNAASPGDIVYGATTKNDVLKAYQNNRDQLGRADIRAIFNHYGIHEDQILNARLVTIADSDNKNYINTSRVTTQFPDTFVPIQGATNGGIYEFPLSYWRKSEFPEGYPAITGMSSYGFRFWILLKGCGNVVFEKGTRLPDLQIRKIRTTAESSLPGDTVRFEIQFRNTGFSPATNVRIVDELPSSLEYVSYRSNTQLELNRQGQVLRWRLDNNVSTLPSTDRWFTIYLTTKVKPLSISQRKVSCNSARIAADGNLSVVAKETDRSCIVIAPTVCPGTGLPIPAGGLQYCTTRCPDGRVINYTQSCSKPQLSCSELSASPGSAWNKKVASPKIIKQPGAAVKEVRYFVDNKLIATVPGAAQNLAYTYTLANGEHTLRATLVPDARSSTSEASCSAQTVIREPVAPEAIIQTDKSVSNETQRIVDANGTTAKPDDVLQYKIFVKNSGQIAATIKLEGEYGESIADILEYATLIDKGDAQFEPTTGYLTWGTVTVKPGETIEKSFRVKVKNPIPATPTSTSNPLSFDGVMHNKYGRDVTLKLDRPAIKVIEQSAATLPNTGPGNALMLCFSIAVLAGYFYYRARLLRGEAVTISRSFMGGV